MSQSKPATSLAEIQLSRADEERPNRDEFRQKQNPMPGVVPIALWTALIAIPRRALNRLVRDEGLPLQGRTLLVRCSGQGRGTDDA